MLIGRGFYGVVDESDVAAACALAERLVAGGATSIQLRLKHAPANVVLAVARALRSQLRDVVFVVNDRLDLAPAAGADAVHLGQDDLPLEAARWVAAGRLQIGVSTHNVAQVEAAVRGGADYLGFGPVFATSTKENPDLVQGLEGLAAAVRVAGTIPVVAIGGITPEQALAVAQTGAWAACAISSVNRAVDIVAAGQRIARAFGRTD